MGSGEPILFIHGGPGLNHSYFLPHVKPLAKRNNVILYDQRASGKSASPSPDSTTLDFFTMDIESIRENQNHEKIFIVAHSWGAIPAVEYCIRFPEKVKGLILCNAVPLSREFDQEMKANQLRKMSGVDSTDRAIIMGSPNFRAGKATAYRKLLMLGFRNSFYKPANFKNLTLDIPANYKDASIVLFAGLGNDLQQYDYYPELRKFQFPVLILYGEKDAIPLDASKKIIPLIPQATMITYKKSGHFIFIEENRKFTSDLQRFINQNK